MRDDSFMTPKQRVAMELLDAALQMYYAESFFAAIHLAGAAEEIFGRYLEIWKAGKTAAAAHHDESLWLLGYGPDDPAPNTVSKELYQAIFASRNRTKHLNNDGDHGIAFDPLREAEYVIDRALTNFIAVAEAVGIRPTRRMSRFGQERLSDKRFPWTLTAPRRARKLSKS